LLPKPQNPIKFKLIINMSYAPLKKKLKKAGEEDEPPFRARVRDFMENSTVTLIMSMTTLFALFGDDMRLWFTTKEADPYFFGGLCLSFFLFIFEILVNSCVIDDFKFSFFFWLDLIATFSLIPDILWVVELLEVVAGSRRSSL